MIMEWIKIKQKLDTRDWHLWFAWKPVTVVVYPDGNEKRVWLKTILRRKTVDQRALRLGYLVYDTEYKEKPEKSRSIDTINRDLKSEYEKKGADKPKKEYRHSEKCTCPNCEDRIDYAVRSTKVISSPRPTPPPDAVRKESEDKEVHIELPEVTEEQLQKAFTSVFRHDEDELSDMPSSAKQYMMDDTENDDDEDADTSDFISHLERSADIVSSWPEWKQATMAMKIQDSDKTEENTDKSFGEKYYLEGIKKVITEISEPTYKKSDQHDIDKSWESKNAKRNKTIM